jgi:hypothetical protein
MKDSSPYRSFLIRCTISNSSNWAGRDASSGYFISIIDWSSPTKTISTNNCTSLNLALSISICGVAVINSNSTCPIIITKTGNNMSSLARSTFIYWWETNWTEKTISVAKIYFLGSRVITCLWNVIDLFSTSRKICWYKIHKDWGSLSKARLACKAAVVIISSSGSQAVVFAFR